MKLEPLFSVKENKLIKISDNKECDLQTFKMVELSWNKIEIEEENYNEEFLAALREELKVLDETQKFVILCPVIDKKFEDQQDIENFISTINHTARRIKDCTCVAGIKLPDELISKGISEDSPVNNFIQTLAIKHAQYIYFINKNTENKYNIKNSNFYASIVLL